jgi:phage terminase large subunit GpA-like protein
VKTFLIQGKDPKTGEPFYRSAKGIPWYIYRTGVDTGGSEYDESETTMTEDAYNFLKQFGKNINVIGTKGRGGFATGQKMKEAPDNIKVGNLIKTREFSLWLIDSGGFKDLLHYKLQIKIGEPGSFTMNSEVKNDFIKHLMAQEKRRNKKGIYEWMQVYKDDHLLDCTVIALACGDAECWTGVRGFRERGGDNPEPPSPQPIQPKDHPFYGSSRVTKVEEKKSLNRQPGWKWGR